MRLHIQVDDGGALAALQGLHAAGRDLTPVMSIIGRYLEEETQRHFDREAAPDGTPWLPSVRAREDGGKTLTASGDLRDSITHQAGPDHVDVGVNTPYAAIHQVGGVIKAKNAPALVFRIGDVVVIARQVTIPARPYLGMPQDGPARIGELIADWLAREAGV